MSYETYLKEQGIDKDKPVQIEWNEIGRCFYCPTCGTGTAADTKKCVYCGQLLIGYYDE
ncbi:MAG: hypothetical protein HFH41_13855 [Lachnospiraceae bacterium]|nr:hypothetical protein [Lachnospiraceae bacterium]